MKNIRNPELQEHIKGELAELESRDLDTLHMCIIENLEELGWTINDALEKQEYVELRSQLKPKPKE